MKKNRCYLIDVQSVIDNLDTNIELWGTRICDVQNTVDRWGCDKVLIVASFNKHGYLVHTLKNPYDLSQTLEITFDY
jgi:hypothetical protein